MELSSKFDWCSWYFLCTFSYLVELRTSRCGWWTWPKINIEFNYYSMPCAALNSPSISLSSLNPALSLFCIGCTAMINMKKRDSDQWQTISRSSKNISMLELIWITQILNVLHVPLYCRWISIGWALWNVCISMWIDNCPDSA